jgi:hypothetical protein
MRRLQVHLHFLMDQSTQGADSKGIVMDQSPNILDRLQRIEELLHQLVERETAKEWYTTEEIAKKLDRAEFTVREWCRLGRIDAEKRQSGRGKYQAWVVSHDELERYQRDGLLPLPNMRLAA